MSINTIVRILSAHGIDHAIDGNNHIYADSEVLNKDGTVTHEWVDMTNKSYNYLMAWLGY